MDSAHVIALIVSNLMVRNQLAVNGAGDDLDARERAIALLGDPIEEAKLLIQQVMSDEPKMPDAPNTKGGMPSAAVGG